MQKNWAQPKVKTIYDISSLAVSVGMSLLFWQNIRGIGIGTLAGALLNGPLIHLFGCWLDRGWIFRDRLAIRAFWKSEEKQ